MSDQETIQQSDPKWDAACNKLTGVHCGRLDLSSYDGAGGEMQRFVYSKQHRKGTRTEVRGPFCDEVAYMAAMYPVLRAKLVEAEKSLSYIRGLHAASAELVGADYEAYQDETPALIARMFKDAEAQRDEAVGLLREADNKGYLKAKITSDDEFESRVCELLAKVGK